MKIESTHIMREIVDDFGENYSQLVKVHELHYHNESIHDIPLRLYVKEYETGKGQRMKILTKEEFITLQNTPLI